MSFIEVRGVHFAYDPTEGEIPREVLHGVDLQIEKGEFVALLGHNGCGKSTMAKLLNGMLHPTGGNITVGGVDTRDDDQIYEVRCRVGLIQQNPDNQLVASIVEEDVAFGPENLGIEPAEIRRRVDDALKSVDMYEYREHATYKLSGGQKQRVAIAGIIAMQPECIVLDEPTAMLDPVGRQEVIATVTRLCREQGITVVHITHHMDECIGADRLIVMSGGHIVADGAPAAVFSQVEMLRAERLDVPATTRLIYELDQNGMDLPMDALSVHDCAAAIAEALKNKGINKV